MVRGRVGRDVGQGGGRPEPRRPQQRLPACSALQVHLQLLQLRAPAGREPRGHHRLAGPGAGLDRGDGAGGPGPDLPLALRGRRHALGAAGGGPARGARRPQPPAAVVAPGPALHRARPGGDPPRQGRRHGRSGHAALLLRRADPQRRGQPRPQPRAPGRGHRAALPGDAAWPARSHRAARSSARTRRGEPGPDLGRSGRAAGPPAPALHRPVLPQPHPELCRGPLRRRQRGGQGGLVGLRRRVLQGCGGAGPGPRLPPRHPRFPALPLLAPHQLEPSGPSRLGRRAAPGARPAAGPAPGPRPPAPRQPARLHPAQRSGPRALELARFWPLGPQPAVRPRRRPDPPGGRRGGPHHLRGRGDEPARRAPGLLGLRRAGQPRRR